MEITFQICCQKESLFRMQECWLKNKGARNVRLWMRCFERRRARERLFLLSIVVLYTYIWLFYSPLSLKSTRSPFGELSVEEDGDHSRKTAALHINEGAINRIAVQGWFRSCKKSSEQNCLSFKKNYTRLRRVGLTMRVFWHLRPFVKVFFEALKRP